MPHDPKIAAESKLACFMNVCKSGSSVVVLQNAEIGSRALSRLDFEAPDTGKKILKYLRNVGITNPKYQNTKPLETWEGDEPAPTVYAFSFLFNVGNYRNDKSEPDIFGYIAFYSHPENGRWTLKSFTRNDNSAPLPQVKRLAGSTDIKRPGLKDPAKYSYIPKG